MLILSIILLATQGQFIMSNFTKSSDSKQQQQSPSVNENTQKTQLEKHQDQQKNAENKPNISTPKEHSESPVK